MSTHLPRISVITPSFNQGRYIEETIKSVTEQDYPNLEYMIFDGGSVDNSLEVIRRYEDRIHYWESKKDNGQAAAINKGFLKASGQILCWINSDDILLPGSLNLVGETFLKNQDDIILGDTILFSSSENSERRMFQYGVTFENMVLNWKGSRMTWCQPGTFFPRSVVEKIGLLDEGFRYVFDREYLCRVLKHYKVTYIYSPLAKFRLHPASKTVGELEKWPAEQVQVSLRYLDEFPGVTSEEVEAESLMCWAALPLVASDAEHSRRLDAFRILYKALRLYPPAILSMRAWQIFTKCLSPRFVWKLLDGAESNLRGYLSKLDSIE